MSGAGDIMSARSQMASPCEGRINVINTGNIDIANPQADECPLQLRVDQGGYTAGSSSECSDSPHQKQQQEKQRKKAAIRRKRAERQISTSSTATVADENTKENTDYGQEFSTPSIMESSLSSSYNPDVRPMPALEQPLTQFSASVFPPAAAIEGYPDSDNGSPGPIESLTESQRCRIAMLEKVVAEKDEEISKLKKQVNRLSCPVMRNINKVKVRSRPVSTPYVELDSTDSVVV